MTPKSDVTSLLKPPPMKLLLLLLGLASSLPTVFSVPPAIVPKLS